MITAQIKSIDKVRHQASNSNFLDVAFDIVEGDSVIESRRIGLPANSSKGEVELELRKIVSTFISDRDRAAQQAEVDAEDENITSLQSELVGSAIASESDAVDA